MSDYISRQAAIDALHMHLMYRMGTDSNKKRLDDWINGVPSAQPEKRTNKRTETHSCDLISRQAAIDALGEKPLSWTEDEYEFGLQNQWQSDVDAIKALPSAQTELIRCKDCGHFHYDMPYVIQGVPVLGHEVCDFWGDGCKTSENGYCSFAEKREDERPES